MDSNRWPGSKSTDHHHGHVPQVKRERLKSTDPHHGHVAQVKRLNVGRVKFSKKKWPFRPELLTRDVTIQSFTWFRSLHFLLILRSKGETIILRYTKPEVPRLPTLKEIFL